MCQIETEGSLKIEKGILRFLAQNIKRQESYDRKGWSSKVGQAPLLAVSSTATIILRAACCYAVTIWKIRV